MTSHKLQILALAIVPALVFAASARAADAPANDTNSVSVTPGFRSITVSGDVRKFRQLNMMNDGFTGGLEEFTIDQRTAKNLQVHADGHVLFEEQDYKLNLEITKPEAWFLNTSFSQYRKYYDNIGGAYSYVGYPAQYFSLNRDLCLNIGDFSIDFGLTLPNLPKLTLGYERQYKDGSKSLTGWNSFTVGATQRKIYPTSKDINETVDILKLSAEHDIKNIHIADDFRYEFYNNKTTRAEAASFTAPIVVPASTSFYREQFDNDSLFNTFRVDSHLNEKVYWSFGYLFTDFNGDNGFQVLTIPSIAASRQYYTSQIAVKQTGHILNGNAMFGPFSGLTLNCGIQGELNDSRAHNDGNLKNQGAGDVPIRANTSADLKQLEENMGLRYTKIPFTTLYTDGRFRQGSIGQGEDEFQAGSVSSTFTRQYDTVINSEDVRVGFNASPISKVTWSGYCRYNETDNDYQQIVDTDQRAAIAEQKFMTKELGTKLTVRPVSRLSLALKYQLVSTKIQTTSTWGPNAVYNNRKISDSGHYDSHIYTVSTTVTPINRLYLTSLFSYQDSATFQTDYNNPIVQSFSGNVFSEMTSCGYAIDDKTDIKGDYSVSWAMNNQANSTIALPLGANYTQHAATLTLSRQITAKIKAQLRYGMYQYNDNTMLDVNNYTAHMVLASCAIRF
ncbi:MAG: hypothetical protein WCH84_02785 [Verrucomicrobiota bacterium]